MGITIFSHDGDNETGKTLYLPHSKQCDDEGEDYSLRAIYNMYEFV